MKAVMYSEYGAPDVLKLKEIATPIPRDNEILVRVYAASVNFGDIMARNIRNISPDKFYMPLPLLFLTRISFGYFLPKINILGSEFAGTVEATGKSVSRFKTGDQVFGYLGMNMGAYAEYLCMPENGTVAIKPANMTYEEAAVIPYGAIMALSLLRRLNIQPGQKALVNGASGGIGSMAVQLASYFGADVTGVCGTQRLEYVKSLGADKVIDYSKEDFCCNGEKYDVIFDVLGKSSFSRCKNSLMPDGILLYASFKMRHLFQMLWTSLTGSRKVICAFANEKTEDLDFIRELIEAGKVKTLIDQAFPMEQAARAHRYVENGQRKGNVVITMQ